MSQAEPARPDRWRWALKPLAIGLGSRVFSIGVLLGLSAMRGTQPNPLAGWDTFWYWRIVTSGYHAELLAGARHDFAFFPGWPIAIKIASFGQLDPFAVSVVLANCLFVLGAVLAWRLLADRVGQVAATSGIALLSFAPASYAFSMGYSESMLLCASAACLLARPAWLRAVLAAVSSLTRLTGVALAASAAVVARWGGGRRSVAVATAAGAAAGFAAWFAYVAFLTKDPMGFFSGSSSWIQGSVAHHQLVLFRAHELPFVLWLGFVGLVALGSLFAVRDDLELGAFAIAVVAIAVGSLAAVSANSIARYALPAFPAYAGLGKRIGPRASALLAVIFAIAEVAFASWTIGPGRVPP